MFFTASSSRPAKERCQALTKRYGQTPLDVADVIVAIGGDGFMLRTIHSYVGHHKPIYGVNMGTVGFLMNTHQLGDDLLKPISQATQVHLNLLRMTCMDTSRQSHQALAVNDVSLFRQTHQLAKIRILVDGKSRLNELACDGVLVATPAGSTAYNFSVYGPIMPLKANLLALTPISAFRPRRWRGALLPHTSRITFEVLESAKRPVSVVADFQEFRDIQTVEVYVDPIMSVALLFDPSHPLENRIIDEQFSP